MSGASMVAARFMGGTTWYIGASILLLAAFLRLYGIGTEPLWLDEAYSWWDARQTLDDLWRLVPQCDPHPPLYAALLKGWMAIAGETPAAMRTLGALIGVATTGIVLLAGREISPRAGWIAGLLVAVAPFQIEFAHEARPYSLVAFGAALIVFGALRVLRTLREGADARPGWLALVAGLAIALWSNNTSVLLVAALGIVGLALVRVDPKVRALGRPMVLAVGAAVLLWLPYVPTYLMQAHGIAADFWIQPPNNLWRIANELRFVIGLGSFSLLGGLALLWAVGLVILWRRGLKREAWLLAALVVLPVALNVLVSLSVKPIYLSRALISIAPTFALGMAAALAAIPGPALRHGAVAGLAALRLAAALPLYDEDRKEQWDDIASYVATEAGRDSLVLLVPNELALPLGHALSNAATRVAMRGVPADFPAPGRAARYPSGKCTPSVIGEDLRPLARAVRDRRTVVVVTRRNNVYDPHEGTQAMLRSLGMRLARTREFTQGQLRVQTFQAPRATAAASIFYP